MTMKCAIIDDEPLAVKLLENYVNKTPGLELAGAYHSAVEAMTGLARTPVDLLLLDIQMPEVDGLSFAHMIRNSGTQVVFTTAFSEYAVESYKVCALDYLLKPITYEDFMAAVTKAQLRTSQHSPTQGDLSSGGATQDCIFVKSDYKMVRLRYCDITYIEGLKDYVKIYLSDQRRPVVSLSSMRSLEALLPADFVRVHRSYIVNMQHVSQVERTQLLADNREIPISDGYKEAVQNYVQARTLQSR